MSGPACIPTSNGWVFLYLTSRPAFAAVRFNNDSHPDWGESDLQSRLSSHFFDHWGHYLAIYIFVHFNRYLFMLKIPSSNPQSSDLLTVLGWHWSSQLYKNSCYKNASVFSLLGYYLLQGLALCIVQQFLLILFRNLQSLDFLYLAGQLGGLTMQHFHKLLGSSSEVLMLPTLYVHLKFNFKIILLFSLVVHFVLHFCILYVSNIIIC